MKNSAYMEECIMKRLASLILVLVLVMCAAPCAFAANDGENLVISEASLYEGKVSVNVNTSALSDDAGIVFGATGLEAGKTVKEAGANAFYAYISGDNVNIGEWKAGAWTALGSAKIADKLGADAWAAAKAASTVELSVAFAINGNVRVWINDVAVLDHKDITLSGAQLAYAGAANSGVTADKIVIEGGLELKTVVGEVTYDANTYTLNAKGTQVLAYFANREITDGSIKTTFPVTASSQGGILVGLKDDGASMWEGTKIAYYMLQLRSTNQFRWTLSDGACVTDEIFNAETNAEKKTLAESYIAGRITGYKFAANVIATPCNWFYGSNTTISDLNNIVASFNIGKDSAVIDSSAINASVGSFVDSQPFGGGFYGIRTDKDMEVTVYAINNQVEAMDLEIVGTPANGSLVVKTFPEGSVINSGNKITVSGAGIEQSGDAVLNEDGTYTINYTVTGESDGVITASVDNHIFGTLSAEVDVDGEDDDNTGNQGGDNTGNEGGDNTGDNTDNGATDDGKKDDGKNNSIIWIVVAVAAVAVIAVVIVVIAKKKK